MSAFVVRIGLFIGLFFSLAPVLAQPSVASSTDDYPNRYIRLVVPYAAGAAPDVVARILGEKIGLNVGQRVLLENHGGGGGAIGSALVAKALPDGYTLLLNTAAHAAYPFFNKNLPYDPLKDLAPVSILAKNFGYLLVINPSLPVKSVSNLISLAKANPGSLKFGTAGLGSAMQMAAELMNYLSKVKMTPIHYTGVPAALTDIISGQIELGFPAVASGLPLVKAGRLRVLAISSDKRWSKMPDIMTLAEAGIKGYRYVGWYGLWVPGSTAPGLITKIQNEVVKAGKDPVIHQKFDSQGLELVGSTPQELAKLTEEEFALNKKLTQSMGIIAE